MTGGAESEAGVRLETTAGEISAGKAVFCGGLHADRLARAFGASLDFRIVPFRGEYFAIKNQPEDLVQHLIYPVPDPARPFLGVHLTRKMNGGFTVGPNAVLAMAREGYTNGIISVKDLADSLSYKGFWKLMRRNAGAAAEELSASLVRQLYLRKVHKYCDRIRLQDLAPYRAGVRAQAVGADGRMIDDFVFVRTRHALHVCNAPSPAATSALPIAEHIVDELLA
ncbi:L-2-hydroxyglutarate oxidase [Cereibacter sphaeroides f. sp. denitrificans]